MRPHLFALLFCCLILPLPLFAQEDDDDDDEESSIEIETVPEGDDDDDPSTSREGPTRVPARVKGQKIGIKKVITKSGKFTLLVPSDWQLKERKGKDSVLFDVALPGTEREALIELRLEERNNDPRLLPFGYYNHRRDDGDITGLEIRGNQLPQLVFRDGGDDVIANVVLAFTRTKGYTVRVSLTAPSPEYEVAYDEFLLIAKTLDTSLPAWPPIPKSYKVKKKGGYIFALHPSVSESTKHVTSCIKSRAKAFNRIHGKAPSLKRGAVLPHVFVHHGNTQAKGVYPEVREQGHTSFTDNASVRLFTTPIQKSNQKGTAELHSALATFFVKRRYGAQCPLWVHWGEGSVASVGVMTGKKLPYVHMAYSQWQASLSLPSIRDMQRQPEEDHTEMYSRWSFYYVAFFHAGPKKYRKAYKAFLADVGKNYDPVGAAKRHFEPLGYDTIRNDATDWMQSKIVYFTPK